MIKKLTLILLSIFLVSTIVSAQEAVPTLYEDEPVPTLIAQDNLFDQISALINDQYAGQVMPGPVKMIFGNERANIYIDDESFNAFTVDGKLMSFQRDALPDPTMNIYATKAAVQRILNSDDPLQEADQARRNKEITYKGVGAGKKVKLFFVNVAAKLAGLFI
jgi:uncharacterized membrane protein